MAQLNANTPYIGCYIRNKYIFNSDDDGLTEGYIFGVKSMINRPMHFIFNQTSEQYSGKCRYLPL